MQPAAPRASATRIWQVLPKTAWDVVDDAAPRHFIWLVGSPRNYDILADFDRQTKPSIPYQQDELSWPEHLISATTRAVPSRLLRNPDL